MKRKKQPMQKKPATSKKPAKSTMATKPVMPTKQPKRTFVGDWNRLHLGSEPVDERLEHRIELEFGGRSHRRGQLRRVIADGNHLRSGQQRHRQQY